MSTKAKIKAVALVRVSTKAQDNDRQESELREKAKQLGWEMVEVIAETISGNAKEEDRMGLTRAVELAQAGSIQKVMVTEITRVARRNSVTHKFVEDLTEAGVSLYWHGYGMETLLPNGKFNPMTGAMLAMMAEYGRNERELIAERTKSGLEEARRKGVTLGRPKGSVVSNEEFLEKNKAAVRLITENPNLSMANLAKLAEMSEVTLRKVKRAMEAQP